MLDLSKSPDIEELQVTPDRIVVAIPCYDTASFIADIVSASRKYVDEVVVIDDGSKDSTASKAKDAGASVISHQQNRGKGVAMKTAIENIEADAIIFIDGDGQHDPNDIPQLLQPIIDGKAGFVIGSRFLPQSKVTSPPIMRIITNGIASTIISIVISFFIPIAMSFNSLLQYCKLNSSNKTVNRTSNNMRRNKKGIKADTGYRLANGRFKWITDCTSGYRAIRKDNWQNLNLISNRFQIETEMIYEAAKNGLSIAEVPISCKWGQSISKLSIVKDGSKTLMLLWNKLIRDAFTKHA